MVSLGNQERNLIYGLTACLAIALRRSENYTLSDVNKVKVQKLVYLAAKEFDLDLTYSWYLAGSYAAGATEGETAVKTAFEQIPQPPSPSISGEDESSLDDQSDVSEDVDEIAREFEMEQEVDRHLSAPESQSREDIPERTDLGDYHDWFDSIDAELIPDSFDIPIDDVVDFYQRILRQYPLHPTDRFLHQFYEYHAPEEYATLYEHSLQLRSILRSLGNDMESLIEGNDQSVDFDNHRQEFSLELSEFHMELYGKDDLRQTTSLVVRATEPIEEFLIKLSALSLGDISTEHLKMVEKIQNYFFSSVWRYPAIKISIETATGPSAAELASEHREEFQAFGNELEEEIQDLIEDIETEGMRPEPSEYPETITDSQIDAIGDLMSSYQEQTR